LDASRPPAAEAAAQDRSAWNPRRLPRALRRSAAVPEGRAGGAVLKRDALYRRWLAVSDVAAAALVLGVVVVGEDSLAAGVLIALPLLVLVSKAAGLYDRDEHLLRKTTLDEVPRLFHLATVFALGIWLTGDLLVEGHLGRDQVLALWLFLFVAMVLGRALVRRIVSHSATEERCLVLGDCGAQEQFARKLSAGHGLKATVVGRVPFERDDPGGNGELGSMKLLGLVLAEHDIQRVIIAPRTTDSDSILDAIRVVKALGVKVSVLPRLFEVVGSSVEFDDVDGMMVLGLRRHGLTHSSRMVKRATDVVGAAAAMAVLSPVLLVIAACVRLGSPGPILFRQRRIGSEDGAFEMLKFRTMVDGAETQRADLAHLNETAGLFKIGDDPRLTKVGRFLRRASLDELPQLLNVVRGDMSLVGPRPLVLEEDRLVQGWERRRLVVAPGMTGLWQIFGSSRIPLEEMVKIDYLYVANWSLWLDAKILVRTLPYMRSRRGI
jgi:exopolysaccharide biosynthesis polyprenyl glycosylphosphotransferase